MWIEVKTQQENSDFYGPVIDIHYTNKEEGFEIGRIFETICNSKSQVWRSEGFIRIPLTPESVETR